MLYQSKRENISRSLTIGWTFLVGTIIIKHSLTALLAWPNINIETPNKEKRNRLFLISSCFARKRSGIIDLVVLGVTLVISLKCLPLFCFFVWFLFMTLQNQSKINPLPQSLVSLVTTLTKLCFQHPKKLILLVRSYPLTQVTKQRKHLRVWVGME